MSWIDSRGATLSELHKRGGLWVVEKLPDTGREKVECWTATAKPKEKVQGLVSQWAQSGRLGKLPRTMEMRMRYFEAAMRHQGELMLIVRDALGRERLRQPLRSHSTTLDLHTLSDGIYILELLTPHKRVATQRLVVQH